jgi:hypothetical protein
MNTPDPGYPWFAGLGMWCRIWQAQIDHSMRLWALWAGALPRPTAADLAAQAERQRERVEAAPKPAPRAMRTPRSQQRDPMRDVPPAKATVLH